MISVERKAAGNKLKTPPQKGLNIFDKKTAKLTIIPAKIDRPIFCPVEYFMIICFDFSFGSIVRKIKAKTAQAKYIPTEIQRFENLYIAMGSAKMNHTDKLPRVESTIEGTFLILIFAKYK